MTKKNFKYILVDKTFFVEEKLSKKERRESMKNFFVAAIVMYCVVVALAGASYAWQGRMAVWDNPTV